MRILVVQLARYGDIYQTWPILRAMKQKWPSSEIHVLVRQRFVSALEGLKDVDIKIHVLDTANFLHILKSDESAITLCLDEISHWLEELQSLKFDRLINLSFSPFSSFLTAEIAGPQTLVRGYTRTSDGYLAIPDDTSAYFYAQVGVGKYNRAHLIEIFAAMAEVEIQNFGQGFFSDRELNIEHKEKIFNEHGINHDAEFIIIHISASDVRKTLSWSKWAELISGVLAVWSGNIILIGGAEDKLLSDRIIEKCDSSRLYSFVAKIQLQDVLFCMPWARLVIGGDSVAMQMATLAEVECFNLSLPIVNFWETGPITPGSRVVFLDQPQKMDTYLLVKEIKNHLEEKKPEMAMAVAVDESPVHFRSFLQEGENFQWEFIQALYLQVPFPLTSEANVIHGFFRLHELADLALKQIMAIDRQSTRSLAIEILTQVDSLIESLGRVVAELQPLVSWFFTEKIRIGPGTVEEVTSRTRQVFESLKMVASLYTGHDLKLENKDGESEYGDKSLVS